jgi:hypothetical protein
VPFDEPLRVLFIGPADKIPHIVTNWKWKKESMELKCRERFLSITDRREDFSQVIQYEEKNIIGL